jgi:hypothetical protein
MFEGKVMGIPKKTEEEILEEMQMKRDVLGGTSKALQTFDFQNKIMGGGTMADMEGKLPTLSGAGGYQDKLDVLLGTKGGKGKKDGLPFDILGGGYGSTNKVGNMLGTEGKKLNAKQRAEYMLGMGDSSKKSSADPGSKFVGGFDTKTNKKINEMLGGKPKIGEFANVNNMFTPQKSQKIATLDPTQKVSQFVNGPSPSKTVAKTANPFKNGYTTPVNVSAMLGFGGAVNTKVSSTLGFGGEPDKKVAAILGGAGGPNPLAKMLSNQPGVTKNPEGAFDINKIIGTTPGKVVGSEFDAGSKINNILGKTPTGNGGFTQSVNVERFLPQFGTGAAASKHSKQSNGWDKPDFRSPGNVGFDRAKQQLGLTMWGDYDGDGLANAVDCDPRDKLEQGFFEKTGNFLSGKGFKDSEEEAPANEATYSYNALQDPNTGEVTYVDAQGNPTDDTPFEEAAKPGFLSNAGTAIGGVASNMAKPFVYGYEQAKGAITDTFEIASDKREIQKQNLEYQKQNIALKRAELEQRATQGYDTSAAMAELGEAERGLYAQQLSVQSAVTEALMSGQKPGKGSILTNVDAVNRRRLVKQVTGALTPEESLLQMRQESAIAQQKQADGTKLSVVEQNALVALRKAELDYQKQRVESQAEVAKAEAYAEAGYGPSMYGKGKRGKQAARGARAAARNFGNIDSNRTSMGDAVTMGKTLGGLMGVQSGVGSLQNAEGLTGVYRGSGFGSQSNISNLAAVQSNPFRMAEAVSLGQGGGNTTGLATMSQMGVGTGEGDFAYKVAESLGEGASSQAQNSIAGQQRPSPLMGWKREQGPTNAVDLPIAVPTMAPARPPVVYAPQPQAQLSYQPQQTQEAPSSLREQYATANPNRPPLPDGRVWSPRSRKYVMYPRGTYDKYGQQA